MTTSSQEWPAPPHVYNLLANINDVARLVAIHQHLTGNRRGRRSNVEVLNKSALVLLVACWEAFVEDLAISAFDALLDNATAPTHLPQNLLTFATKPLRESKDERDVWKLAGNGWKEVLIQHRQATIERFVGKLNTPKPDQVDELIERMCGVRTLSSSWKWKGSTAARNRARIEALVALRGEIAHRVSAARAVHKRDVSESVDFVHRLATTSSNAVAMHFFRHHNFFPWRKVVYGSTG